VFWDKKSIWGFPCPVAHEMGVKSRHPKGRFSLRKQGKRERGVKERKKGRVRRLSKKEGEKDF
jgi:hypothetical protein